MLASTFVVGCSFDSSALDDSRGSSESGTPSETEGDGDPGDGDPGDGDPGDGDPGDGDPGDGDPGDGDPGDGDPNQVPAGCGQPSPGPGTHTNQTLTVNGVSRSYELFVPVTYDPDQPSSLVLNFHGLLGTPSQQASFSQFNQSATLRGMVVAYPAGIGNSFNAGACCGQAHSDNVDDVGFALALVDELLAQMCIDPKRVYVTGMSNGGHMAHTLACQAADVFAAAASVTGVLGLPPAQCQPARPISMIDFHGTSDWIVSYNGAGPGYPPVRPMMEGWAARNGCSPVPELTFDQGDTLCETWPGCDDEVEVTLCTIDGGGHCWPGNGSCLFGHSTTVLHASEVIADMFLAQTLP